MALIVQKYGGTSVGNIERIQAVADRVIGYIDRGDKVAVVVSAMSGETNKLVALGRSAAARPSTREMDVLQATGEQVTIALLAIVLSERGYPARSYLAHQVGIHT